MRLPRWFSNEISGVVFDSRKVEAGSAFVAIRGEKSDGHSHLHEAAKKAVALVVEDRSNVPADYKGDVVTVANTRQALNQLAADYYENPSQKLFVVGVTGTNGKTTTTNMVEKILNEHGLACGVIGTIDHHLGDKTWPSELTTPDPVEFQKRLAEFVSLGAKSVCLEVSSHALVQSRIDEVQFDVAVFTNLTRDHLDYHKTMEAYFIAKAKLFHVLLPASEKKNTCAVINIDDEYGVRLSHLTPTKKLTYGKGQADIQFQVTNMNYSGTKFNVKSPNGSVEFNITMTGLHNVYNACAAISVGLAAGATLETCSAALAKLEGVSGRLQSVRNSRGVHIFVDYAHTDDALRNSLRHLDEIRKHQSPSSKLICVFGCGGDRDKGKRPLMFKAANEFADVVVVTSDNPRTEDPGQIIRDIVGTSAPSEKCVVELDRKSAIFKALAIANQGDAVLIAGKGHEDYQIIGTKKMKFSDFEVVKEYFA